MSKFLILVFIACFAISTKAQTFIGKTEGEIKDYVKNNGYNLEGNDNDPVVGIRIFIYSDLKLNRNYLFHYGKDGICVAYTIQTDNALAMLAALKEVDQLATEKISDRSWIQKTNDKVYGCHYQGSEKFASFTTTEIKQ
jgi:hypothetical protein